jgi:hypothetical protein
MTLNIASNTKQQKNLSSDMDLPSRNKPFKKNEITPHPFQFFLATVWIDNDFIYFLSPTSKFGT